MEPTAKTVGSQDEFPTEEETNGANASSPTLDKEARFELSMKRGDAHELMVGEDKGNECVHDIIFTLTLCAIQVILFFVVLFVGGSFPHISENRGGTWVTTFVFLLCRLGGGHLVAAFWSPGHGALWLKALRALPSAVCALRRHSQQTALFSLVDARPTPHPLYP